MASTRRETRRPQSRSASASPAARVATRRSRASRSPWRMRTITDVPVRRSPDAGPADGSGMPAGSPGQMPSKGWGSSAGGGGTSLARASASSHSASDSRASWQPASAFSDEIRAASASAESRSRAGSWARSSALPASRIRWASRTAPLSSLILVSQVRAALSVSSGLPDAVARRPELGVEAVLLRRDPARVRRGLGPVDAVAEDVVGALGLAQGVCRAAGLVAGDVGQGAALVEHPALAPRTAPRRAPGRLAHDAGIGHARGLIGAQARACVVARGDRRQRVRRCSAWRPPWSATGRGRSPGS